MHLQTSPNSFFRFFALYRQQQTPLILFCLLMTAPVWADNVDKISSSKNKTSIQTSETSLQAKGVKKSAQINSLKHRKKYMQTITADPDDFELDNVSQVQSSSVKKTRGKKEINWDINMQQNNPLLSGLSFNQFEKSLQENYFVTFALYSKLNPTSKNMVYQSYRNKPTIEDVTESISQLMK